MNFIVRHTQSAEAREEGYRKLLDVNKDPEFAAVRQDPGLLNYWHQRAGSEFALEMYKSLDDEPLTRGMSKPMLPEQALHGELSSLHGPLKNVPPCKPIELT